MQARMEDAMTSTQAEVRAILDSRIEACRAKDIDRLMSLYSPDIVHFDCVPPLEFVGSDAVRRNFLRWFDEYEGTINLETHHLNIAISESGDVAFVHMLHLDTGTMDLDNETRERNKEQARDRTLWLRSTVCLQRSDDKWLVTHEHISLPVDLETMIAIPDAGL
jgi:ketosteroid isomerase-like protein